MNKDVIEFYRKQGKIIKSIPLTTETATKIYYHGDLDGSKLPLMQNVVAFEYADKSISYRFNGNYYRNDKDIMKILNLSIFC